MRISARKTRLHRVRKIRFSAPTNLRFASPKFGRATAKPTAETEATNRKPVRLEIALPVTSNVRIRVAAFLKVGFATAIRIA